MSMDLALIISLLAIILVSWIFVRDFKNHSKEQAVREKVEYMDSLKATVSTFCKELKNDRESTNSTR